MPIELSRSLKDGIAGTVAGSFQVLAGQPFDTIKVRLQSNTNQYRGIADCLIKLLREEGPLALYKGTLTPLLGVGGCVAIQFFSLEAMKRYLKTGSDPLNFSQLYIAGAASGLANTILAGPIEHIRIKQQMNLSKNSIPTLKLINSIYQNYGIKGLFKGQMLTMIRDFHAYGIYFAFYETMIQNHLSKHLLKERGDIPLINVAFYGILSGFGYWLSVYPIDVIKTNVQAEPLTQSTSTYKWAKIIYYRDGIKGFFRGLIPCLLRTIPAASSTFLGFELAMKFLN